MLSSDIVPLGTAISNLTCFFFTFGFAENVEGVSCEGGKHRSGEPCSPGAAWAGTTTVVLQQWPGHLVAEPMGLVSSETSRKRWLVWLGTGVVFPLECCPAAISEVCPLGCGMGAVGVRVRANGVVMWLVCSETRVTLMQWAFWAQCLCYPVSQWCVPPWFSLAVWDPTCPFTCGQVLGTALGLITRTLKHLVPKLSQRTYIWNTVTIAPPARSPSPTGFP